MESNTLDLDKIERLARAATPGPWVREPHGGRRISEPGGYAICYVEMDDDVALTESDAAYIAHMHPARVLALVERAREVGELRSALENIATILGGTVTPGASHEFHLMVPLEVEAWRKKADALRARIATLEADLRDIGAALCTSDGILIPDELNNLERIESLHRVLKLAFDARKKAEAERDTLAHETEICKAIIKHCGGSFVVKCMLCGAPYDVRDPDWLKHDLTCPKHPMRDVERERDESRSECDRLRAERDEARTAAELWSQELREAREATAKATQEAETFRHARDLLHDEAEEARDERDTLRAERDALARRMVKAVEVLKERCSCDESPALFAITKCKLALLALTTDALEKAGLMGEGRDA